MTGETMNIIVFGGGGFVLIAIGGFLLIRKRLFVAAAKRACGPVVAHEVSNSGSANEPETYYHPIFEFKDAAGRPRRVTSSAGFCPKPYADGAAVPAAPAGLRRSGLGA